MTLWDIITMTFLQIKRKIVELLFKHWIWEIIYSYCMFFYFILTLMDSPTFEYKSKWKELVQLQCLSWACEEWVQWALAIVQAVLQSRDSAAVWLCSPESNKWSCQAISAHIPLQSRELHFSAGNGWQTTVEKGAWPWWLQWHCNQLRDRNWFWKRRSCCLETVRCFPSAL